MGQWRRNPRAHQPLGQGQIRTRTAWRDAARSAVLPSRRSAPRMTTMLRRCPRLLPGRGGPAAGMENGPVQRNCSGTYLGVIPAICSQSTEFLCPLHATFLQVKQSCDTHRGCIQAHVQGLAYRQKTTSSGTWWSWPPLPGRVSQKAFLPWNLSWLHSPRGWRWSQDSPEEQSQVGQGGPSGGTTTHAPFSHDTPPSVVSEASESSQKCPSQP